MARIVIGTEAIQVAWQNPKRRMLSVEYLPVGIEAANLGLIYGKFGSPPVAAAASNTWDFVMVPGAATGTNFDENLAEAPIKKDLWLISDTAAQIVSVTERNIGE